MAAAVRTAEPQRYGVWGPPGASAPRRVRPERWLRHWGLGDVLIGFVGLLVAQVFLVVAFVFVAARRIGADGSPDQVSRLLDSSLDVATSGPGLITGLLTQWAAFLGAPVYASYRKGRRSLAADFGFRFRWRADAVLGLSLAAALQVILGLLNIGLSAAGVDVSAADNTGLVTGSGGLLLVALILAAVLGAPIVEEVFFRGLFLRALLRRFAKRDLVDPQSAASAGRRGGTALSIIVTAAVFGVLHAPFAGAGNQVAIEATMLLAAQTGLLGLVFAVVAVKVGRLGPTVIAHVLFNATSVALALLSAG